MFPWNIFCPLCWSMLPEALYAVQCSCGYGHAAHSDAALRRHTSAPSPSRARRAAASARRGTWPSYIRAEHTIIFLRVQ